MRPSLVLFDGDCAVCHGLVKLLLAHEKRNQFRFLPLSAVQGTARGAELARAAGGRPGESVWVVAGDRVLDRSDAVLFVLGSLGGGWTLLGGLRIIPRAVRDFCYDLFARVRYRIFGRADLSGMCAVLPPEARALMLTRWPDD